MTTQTASAISCTETSYTASNGLEFSLYCNEDRTKIDDVANAGADSVESCVEQCSIYFPRLCGGAAFDTNELMCYFKNANVTAQNATQRNGWILSIANADQLQPISAACTNNGANQSAQNGLNFTVYCDQTVIGLDLCPDDAPSCRAHATTFQDCLDHCSTQHPLCTGVAWDPTFQSGYQNCYPKAADSQTFDNTRIPNSNGFRVGKALLSPTTDECPSIANGTLEASNHDVFQLTCNQDYGGNNITAQHADSLGACIDLCTNTTNTACVGVVFDTTCINGYENCYLKSVLGRATSQLSGVTFAQRENVSANSSSSSSSSPSSASSPSSPSTSSSSSVWIAGPVVGAFVTLVGLAITFLWLRRRKVQKSNPKVSQDVHPQEIYETGGRELLQKSEVDGEPIPKLRLHELESKSPELEAPLHAETA